MEAAPAASSPPPPKVSGGFERSLRRGIPSFSRGDRTDSGADQQPWTFVVVSDAPLKREPRAAAEAEEERLYTERASREYLEAIEPIGTDWNKPHITILVAVGYPAEDSVVPQLQRSR